MSSVGDPITLVDSDPTITFMKVIVTFYLLLWIRLLFSFSVLGALIEYKSKYSPTRIRLLHAFTVSDMAACFDDS